jgi:ANTH domain
VSFIQTTLVSAWDCSAWVRTYALFLEEKLECFRVLKYDIEAERLSKPSPAAEKVFFFFNLHVYFFGFALIQILIITG